MEIFNFNMIFSILKIKNVFISFEYDEYICSVLDTLRNCKIKMLTPYCLELDVGEKIQTYLITYAVFKFRMSHQNFDITGKVKMWCFSLFELSKLTIRKSFIIFTIPLLTIFRHFRSITNCICYIGMLSLLQSFSTVLGWTRIFEIQISSTKYNIPLCLKH